MQKQILYQFSIRLTCLLLNIVNINLKIEKDIPFSNASLYLFGNFRFRRIPTTSDLQFSIRELFVNISEKFSWIFRNLIWQHCVTRRYREACGIGKNLTIIRFFRFKMRVKFTVADESSRKFSVLYESVVSVAIRCIFMRFSERFRVTLVSDPTWSLQPSIFICI